MPYNLCQQDRIKLFHFLSQIEIMYEFYKVVLSSIEL